MALAIVRRIRGNIHGTIDISETEDAVLKHPYVQRLRRIKQLAFLHYVFPGATHSRFEHSLGVLHMANQAWEKLRANQERLKHSLSRIEDFSELEKKGGGIVHGLLQPTFALSEKIFQSDYILQVVRLAGLLHDLGHPPFSHSGERFLPSWPEVLRANPQAPAFLKDYLTRRIEELEARGEDPTKHNVRHEVMSMFMIEQVLRDTYAQFSHLKVKVDAQDVVAAIASGIAPQSGSPLLECNAYQLIRELVSGELDIDRMDYLIRDSRECGVVYGIFDALRILDSLCLYYDPDDKNVHVAISFSGLAALEDYLRARQSMYLQLYFHKSSVASEAMFKHIEKRMQGWNLPAAVPAYAGFDEYNIGGFLTQLVGSKLKGQDKEEVLALIRDLLYDRRLWKRVYEVAGSQKNPQTEKALAVVTEYLKKNGCRFEQVSSATSLSRFYPREENARSRNYLRLVKKDQMQVPRVYPIEDYLKVVATSSTTFIQRIYVENGPVAEKVKKELPLILKQRG